jgi:diamine N-acetyltransferase
MIKRIKENEIDKLVEVIKVSFITVANEFNITKNNTPTNPAFITSRDIKNLFKKGLIFLGLYLNNELIGCVAVEDTSSELYYIEKLAVLPEFRHKGYGKKLMNSAFEVVKKNGGTRISVGIINENKTIKKWYKILGFKETGLKNFPHLPFTVCFMEKELP